jgi:hypothetical protein
MITEMPSGTSIVVVTVRSPVNSSRQRSVPAGDAAGAASTSAAFPAPESPCVAESSTGSATTTSLVKSSASAS